MEYRKGGALEGVTVLDVTRVLSGPLGTAWLGDMGANIIKIESPSIENADSTRTSTPYKNGESVYFATINRNKRTITLNLKDPKGKEMFLELVKKADVVTENFRTGVMDRLGLGYETLRQVNKKIVMFSLSGYGSNGPYAERPGYDVVAQGMSGIMSVTGHPENPPTKCGPSIGDVVAGMNEVIGVLAALYRAKVTGEGQHVEVALVDAAMALCTQDYIEYSVTNELPKRLGNNYSLWCPYGTYKAAQGYFTIGVGTEKHFENLCTSVLRIPELVHDDRFNGQQKRVEHRSEMDALINNWAKDKNARDVVTLLNNAGIPSSLVYDFSDIDADENFTVYRKMIKHMDHPTIGDIKYINMPIRFFGTPLVEPTAAGDLGQYNAEIYEEYLGLGETEVKQLHADGVI